MVRRTIIGALLGLSTGLPAWGLVRAQGPQAAPAEAAASGWKAGEDAAASAVARLIEQLRRHPARPSATAGQVGLYLIDAEGGAATLIANEPDPRVNQCGSPSWSHDGRRIVFDATPGIAVGNADFTRSHLKSIELDGDRLSVKDLGPGNCPDFSPADDRIVFLLNPGAMPNAQAGVWLMQADGSQRRMLGRLRPAPMVAGESPVLDHQLLQPRPGDDHGRPAGAQRRSEYPRPPGLFGPELGRRGDARGGDRRRSRHRRHHRARRRDRSHSGEGERGPVEAGEDARRHTALPGLLARHPALCLRRQDGREREGPLRVPPRQARSARATGGRRPSSTI